MTKQELINGIVSDITTSSTESGEKGTIIELVVVAVVETLVSKCYDTLMNGGFRNPGSVKKFVLRKYVSRSCPDRETDREYGDKIYLAFLARGASLSDSQIKGLVDGNSA